MRAISGPAASAANGLDEAIASFTPVSKTDLEAKLERLEATVADAMTRWTDPDDFAKVDLVVSRLLHQGNVDAALMYLKKVRISQKIEKLPEIAAQLIRRRCPRGMAK
jgi:hypothetical protein